MTNKIKESNKLTVQLAAIKLRDTIASDRIAGTIVGDD